MHDNTSVFMTQRYTTRLTDMVNRRDRRAIRLSGWADECAN
jgi:hypothetical protein